MQAGQAWFPCWWFPPSMCCGWSASLPPAQSHGDQHCASSLRRELAVLALLPAELSLQVVFHSQGMTLVPQTHLTRHSGCSGITSSACTGGVHSCSQREVKDNLPSFVLPPLVIPLLCRVDSHDVSVNSLNGLSPFVPTLNFFSMGRGETIISCRVSWCPCTSPVSLGPAGSWWTSHLSQPPINLLINEMNSLSAGVGIRSIFSMSFANWRRVSEKANWDQSCSAWEGCLYGGSLASPSIKVMHEI